MNPERPDDATPERQVGELAARTLDYLDGRPLVGAVLLVAVSEPDDMQACNWFVPDGQPWQMTVGMVEDWKIHQVALIAASAVQADQDDGDEDE